MSLLPKGWKEISIADIADIKGGKRLPKGAQFSEVQTNFPYIRVSDFDKGCVDTTNLKYIDESTHQAISNYVISSDDLYISIAGTIGLVGEIPEELDNANLTENAAKICNLKTINKRYLKYFLQSPIAIQQFIDKTTSSGQPKLALFRIKDCSLGLAPLAEQKRIVEKLDEVLAQVDTIKARLDSIPELLKRFRQSVLASAVSGKLTKEWRTERSLKQWVTLNLNEVTSHVVDCPHSTPKWSDEGRYCVRTTAFNPFYLDLSGQGYVNDEVFEQRTSRLTPEAGDILYSREGTVGIACQIPKGVELCLGQRMVVIRANEKVNAKYLTIVLNSDHILRIVRELTIGSTAPRVNMKVIRDYPIPVPDCIEQKEIVRLVDQYFAFANTIEAQVKKAQARVDNLTQSILAKAFRGELVPQNDDDEPAEVLLKRIAQARKEAEALAKAAKKAAKTKKTSK
ncbi:TPA: restriction endonuclease subunit S [Vibrio parahaemolyticus]|nr:restriction endonuclease subunit S [Vibrio parahaemolyticus]